MRIIILSFFLFSNISAKSQITFNKTYHSGIDATFNIFELSDGYLTASYSGYTIVPGHLSLIKVNFYGDTLWQREFGMSSEYFAFYSLKKITDSTLIAGCYGADNIIQSSFVSLFKLTIDGDTIWTRKFFASSGYHYNGQYLIITDNNSILVTGQIATDTSGDGDGFIMKMDADGNYLWHKIFGGLKYDCLVSSVELPDKGFLSLGWTRSFGFGNSSNRDVYLVKTDSLGNFQWQKTYGDSSFETAVGITSCMDGNYLLSGYKSVNSVGHAWMIKIDTAGSVIWQRTHNFGVLSDLWWSRELTNGDFISAGASKNPANQKDDGLIFCTDANGYVKWHRTFAMNNDHAYFRDVQPTSDGGFICAGFAFVGASGNEDAWLVKLDSLGCDSSGCPVLHTGIDGPEQTGSAYGLQVYPNPASQAVLINVPGQNHIDYFDISLYDITGKMVMKKRQLNTGIAQPLPVNHLEPGLYLIRVEAGDQVLSKKLLIAR